jgi:type IV pilus assembly protein PilZ
MMSAPAERLDPAPDLVVEAGDGETFLFAYVANLHELGVFVRSERPLPIGTRMVLAFSGTDLLLRGEVVWINPVRNHDNPNPGMGIRFVGIDLEDRDRLVSMVRAIAYLDEPADAN